MSAASMVVAGEPGLLQLLGGWKRSTTGGALERVSELVQLIGLCRISAVGSSAGCLLQLTRNLREDGLELLRALRLDLLELTEKLGCGR